MTREEAIKEINLYREFICGGLEEAFNIAIESMRKLDIIENILEEDNE